MKNKKFDPQQWADMTENNVKTANGTDDVQTTNGANHANDAQAANGANYANDAQAANGVQTTNCANYANDVNDARGVAPTPSDTLEQVRLVADRLCQCGADITVGYDQWLRLGFALADGLGEQGRDVYHRLSALNADYIFKECNRQYDQCLRGHGNGIHIATFFHMARKAGVDLAGVARAARPQPLVAATSANPPSGASEEKERKEGVCGGESHGLADGGLAEVAETTASGYTFTDKLEAAALPPLVRAVVERHGADVPKCDAMVLGVLNVVSGLMGGANGTPERRAGVYGVYDGRRVYAPLFNIVYSGAGNEKGNLVFAKLLAQPVKAEMRRRYEAERQDYEAARAEWEAKGKRERGEMPAEPVWRDPFVPCNSSSSAVYRALDANGGWGMMFETEADTLTGMLGNKDYGNYSDLLRKAHHHETLSMNRVEDHLHIDLDEPRLSILLTCTPGQLQGLFPSFENGLGSRFLFYHMPDDDVRFHDVFALRDTPLDDAYRRMGDELLPLYHAMQGRAGRPIQFVMSQAQQREFLQTYREVLEEQFAMLGTGIRAFVFRMALECFRYAMVLAVLRRLGEWGAQEGTPEDGIFRDEENALVCDDRDFRTAMTLVGCLINHTARVYAVMAKDDDDPFAQRGLRLSADEQRLYRALPPGEFRTGDLVAVAEGMGIPRRSAERMLSKLCNVCRVVVPMHRGVYRKGVLS